jgi:hypothetical protein
MKTTTQMRIVRKCGFIKASGRERVARASF